MTVKVQPVAIVSSPVVLLTSSIDLVCDIILTIVVKYAVTSAIPGLSLIHI